MATEVSIVSNALVRLGASPIASFDEGDVTGSNLELVRSASNIWPTVRDAILRSHYWNCCLKRERLSAVQTPPPFGYGAAFRLPSDWVRTHEVWSQGNCKIEYKAEGGFLLCDETVIDLVYVFKNIVPETYDVGLVNVMEMAMAHALAYLVTKSTSLRDALQQEVYGSGGVLAQAKAVDGQDDREQEFGDNPSRMARFGGYGVRGWPVR